MVIMPARRAIEALQGRADGGREVTSRLSRPVDCCAVSVGQEPRGRGGAYLMAEIPEDATTRTARLGGTPSRPWVGLWDTATRIAG